MSRNFIQLGNGKAKCQLCGEKIKTGIPQISHRAYQSSASFHANAKDCFPRSKAHIKKMGCPHCGVVDIDGYRKRHIYEGFECTHCYQPVSADKKTKYYNAEDSHVCGFCGETGIFIGNDEISPEGKAVWCKSCRTSPCGINDDEDKPCTCDIGYFEKIITQRERDEEHNQEQLKTKYAHLKNAESFEAEDGDDCPSCANACKHDDSNKIKVESIYDYEVQSPSNMVIQVTCLDCGESGTFYADEVDWHGEEAKLRYSPQIAVNMMNPTYGDLRCSRCLERFQMAAETFDVEFNEWADQELMSHGKNISFKDWAEDEGMKHGNTEITDWAQHEDESHDARYGAETFSKDKVVCIKCGIPSGFPHPLHELPPQVAGKHKYTCRNCYDEVRSDYFGAESNDKINLTLKELGLLRGIENDSGQWQDNHDRMMGSLYHDEWDMVVYRGVMSSLATKGIIVIGEPEKISMGLMANWVFVNPKYTIEDDGNFEINWNLFDSKQLKKEFPHMTIETTLKFLDSVPHAFNPSQKKSAESFSAKGIDTFTQPFEGTSLDSGGMKKVLVGIGLGIIGIIGYSNWK